MDVRKLRIFALVLLLLVCQSSVKAGKKRRKKVFGCPTECYCRRYEIDSESDAAAANCRSRNLSAIPTDFSEKEYWIEVNLSSNNISRIVETSFSNIHRVQSLKLSQNNIVEMHPNCFKMLHSLTDLALERNQIRAIPPLIFSDSRNIRNLRLTSNLISNLSAESFVGLHNLKELFLSDNHLTAIPVEALWETPKLEIFKMAMNRITFIPDEAFESLKNLLVLDLRENQIAKIGNNALNPLTLCEELDLSYNRLTEYPSTVTRLEKLIRLEIKSNEIEHLPSRAFSRQIHLKTLTFHNNKFRSVGRWTFSRLPNLTSLLLLNVQEQNYFPELSACTNLRSLSITGSHVTSLPQDLCSNKPYLASLKLSNNRLYKLHGLEMCSSLKSLDVSGNSVTCIKDELKNLTSLKDLNLSDNNIETVGMDSFANIVGLEKLNIASNPLSSLPDKGLGSLNILNVSNTRNLYYLPWKGSMPNLHHLQATYPYHCCLIFPTEKTKSDSEDKKVSGFYTCSPQEGPLTPCSDLLEPGFARVLLWIVLVLTLFFDGFIILLSNNKHFAFCTNCSRSKKHFETSSNEAKMKNEYVCVSRRKTKHFEFLEELLCHLCLADLIAALYVVTIVIYDAKSGGYFIQDAAWWQESIYCKTAGFCLVLGLQLGFYTVFIATLERYLATMYPLNPEKHFKKPVLVLCLSAAWFIAIATGIVTIYNKNRNIHNSDTIPLPPYNGALCLPWSTSFSYVAALVSVHILLCCVMVVLCALMYCKKQKKSWLSARKNTRTQISLVVTSNVICILPLALLGLLASAVVSFPSATEPWLKTTTENEEVNVEKLNVNVMLIIAVLLVSLRFLFNPLLYVTFNKQFRSDFIQMLKATVCLDKEKTDGRNYQNASHTEPAYGPEVLMAFSENHERLPDMSNNVDVLQTLPFCLATRSSEFSDQVVYPSAPESTDSRPVTTDEENNDPFTLTTEHQRFLFYSSDGGSYPNDPANSSSSEDTFLPVEVFPDILEDPFCDEETIKTKASDAGIHFASSTDDLLRKQAKLETFDDDNKLLGQMSSPTGVNSNSFSRLKANRLIAINERKRKRNQLNRLKQDQGMITSNGQMISHSGESSTSKDSGIQSEPDFGAVAPISSTSSSLSRSSTDMDKQANALPRFLVPSKVPASETRGLERSSDLVNEDDCNSLPQSELLPLEPTTFFVLHSTQGKTLLKRETTL